MNPEPHLSSRPSPLFPRTALAALLRAGLAALLVLVAACGSDGDGDGQPSAADAGGQPIDGGGDAQGVDAGQADGQVGIGDTGPTAGADSGPLDAAIDAGPSPCAGVDAGGACDDGDPCTENDLCDIDGQCKGSALSCEDDNPCTADACGAKGCNHAPVEGACDDGDPCTEKDTCEAGKCAPGKQPLACDDGDACTDDTCEAGKGCAHLPVDCADADPCTADACDKAAGCTHTPMKAGDACKTEDKCVIGYSCTQPDSPPGAKLQCLGGKDVDCDDNNLCTDDSCAPKYGCVHKLTGKPCDDGLSCTTADKCVGGLCLGSKTTSCAKCNRTFKLPTAQVTNFQVGASGKPGDGIDVDGNPNTCSPAGKCDSGVDNAFASVAGLVNIPLGQALKDGQLTFVAEFEGYKGENVPFTLNMYYAELTPKSAADKCPFLTKTCNWYVQQSALAADCSPKVSFADAKVVKGKLTAGGKDTLFVMDVVGSGGMAMLYAKGAHIEGEVSFAPDGATIESVKGVIGGAMDKSAFIQVINGMPDSVFPIPKAGIVATMDKALVPDIDIDGDGTAEAASIGLRFSAIHAWLDGMQP